MPSDPFPDLNLSDLVRNDRFEIVPAGKLDSDDLKRALASFRSGQRIMDRWIEERAVQAVAEQHFPLRLALAADGLLLGYYGLVSAQIPRLEAPSAKLRRNKPETIPVCRLAQLAVRQENQGAGLGRLLLFCALAEAERVSQTQQQTAVILDPADEAAAAFYRKFDFLTLKRSETMLLPMATVRALLKDLAQ
jgi:GNAT superfamily N-acetyltransferase